MKNSHLSIRKAVLFVTAFALLVVLIGCASAPASPQPSSQIPATSQGKAITIDLVAQNMAFNVKTITVPAGASVTINFNNKDGGIPHNFSLFKDSSASPPAIYQGEIIKGPATTTYTFTAPTTPGTYFFRCDVHPTTMTGSFIVQ